MTQAETTLGVVLFPFGEEPEEEGAGEIETRQAKDEDSEGEIVWTLGCVDTMTLSHATSLSLSDRAGRSPCNIGPLPAQTRLRAVHPRGEEGLHRPRDASRRPHRVSGWSPRRTAADLC